MKFIVKLFPEMMIKSKPVRQRQVKQLRQNLHTILKRKQAFEGVKVRGFWDKIEVLADESSSAAVADALQRVPGIANILRVQQYHIEDIDNNFDTIVSHTLAAMGESLAGKSFVVRIKRVGKHSFTSHQLEQYVGGGLLQLSEAKCVDLRNADVTVKLEVRDEDLFVVEERFEGLGGYPIGTQDAVLSLISGGFDSTVSSYLTMKRGLKTHFCFFNLGGSAHEIGVKQVSLYLWERYGISHRVKFITVPFEEVVAEILRTVNHSQMGVILKRMMMRAASKIADEMGVEALVTGESVAQVSSQTLTNLNVIDRVTDMLVLRPLITMDKQDIIKLSAQIGTEEFAKTMPEYCGVISDRPTTAAKLDRVLQEEGNFNFDVLESAISTSQIIKIDEVLESQMSIADVEVVSVPSVSDVVVDIRHPDEVDKKPLMLTNNAIERVPFFELMSHIKMFSADKNYLLYCEHGSMSQLHANHLNTMGYANIKVYQPLG